MALDHLARQVLRGVGDDRDPGHRGGSLSVAPDERDAPGMSNAAHADVVGSTTRTATRRADHEVPRADLRRRVAATRTRRRRTPPRSSRRTASSARPRARPACSPAATACSRRRRRPRVRVRDGERMLTDGPYAETKEQLGGYYAARVQGPRRGARLGGADPRGQDRRDRGAPGHGLRRARGRMSAARRPPRPDRPAGRPRRPPVPARVGTGGRRPRPHPRRPRPRRGGGAGRVPDRARALAARRRCPTTRRRGSSPRRATARSTGSAPSGAGRAGASRWRPSCARSAATRTTTTSELVSPIPDDRLRLIFTVCHPGAGARGARGADAARARRADDRPRSRARSSSPSRRWRSGSCAPSARSPAPGIKYEVPRDADLPARLRSVLATVYLVFNAGYGPPVRAGLCAEAIRLGRVLVALMPDEAEAIGLLALMLPAGLAPRGARGRRRPAGPARRPGPLALGRARRSPRASGSSRAAGGSAGSAPYLVQASIAVEHARGSDWDADRLALRRADGRLADADRRAQPRRRDRRARRPGGRPGADGRAPRPRRLPPLPRRPRRPPAPAGPPRRGRRRLPRGARADRQRGRARLPSHGSSCTRFVQIAGLPPDRAGCAACPTHSPFTTCASATARTRRSRAST